MKNQQPPVAAAPSSPTELLDANELAALLKTTTRAIGQARRCGLLPQAIRLPVVGLYRWRRADVEAWIADKASESAREC